MTYCVAMLLDEGLVMAADSRTSAGPDRVSTFQKLAIYEQPNERVFALCTAGNLSITQAVISILEDGMAGKNGHPDLMAVETMYGAARIVGRAVREVFDEHGPSLKAHSLDFNASILLGGQVNGGKLRLFEIYAAGNFIEASSDTPYFQIGEIKYGKPVIDRILTPENGLREAAKCALLSFDSTMRSNVTVGPPIDLAIIKRDSQRVALRIRLEEFDPYWQNIRVLWGEGLNQAFASVPDPDWEI